MNTLEGEFKTLDQVEKSHIIVALELHQGNKSRAAKALGISLKGLYNKLHQYDLFKMYMKQNK